MALVSGAAVISARLNLDLGVEYKLTQEFRTLGANLVISPGRFAQSVDAGTASPILMGQDTVMRGIEKTRAPGHVAAAPYLYIVARVGETPVVVAGTWLDEARKLAPTWKLDGSWVASRDDVAYCLVGRNVARQFNLAPGSALNLKYIDSSAQLTVSGVLDSGGPDDNQIFVSLPVVQRLANLRGIEGQIGLVQLSVQGPAPEISAYAAQLAKALPQFEVRPIRQVTEAEGAMLHRIQLLIVSMVLLILRCSRRSGVLGNHGSACNGAPREDVGLMRRRSAARFRARSVGLFLAEVGVLGASGGLIGCMAGVALSHWMGERVFGAAIAARWEVFPLTVGLMVIVALAGALPLRLLGKIKPAVILRGEM